MIKFSEDDLQQLSKKGITQDKVLKQIETFKEGIPFVKLADAATISNGITKFSSKEEENLINTFELEIKNKLLLKFVPASGAASRMFKATFNFLEKYNPSEQTLEAYISEKGGKDIEVFSKGLKNFPFYNLIQEKIASKVTSVNDEVYLFVKEMLSSSALNYGFFPKGLLPFHTYKDTTATPFEEHLKEAALYAKSGGKAELHFTISEQHNEMFASEFSKVKDRVSKATDTSFKVDYSYQKSATDTIAVTLENNLFRNADGSLLFRPGGHGALIENLNEQNADVIFIKNIDNVVTEEHIQKIANSKKILAGLLLKIQAQVFDYANQIDENNLTGDQLNEMKLFLEKELNVRFSDSFESFTIGQQIDVIKDKMNRPIRVCGMVKNEGEPGGGPFWVKDINGNISLQIVESAQVNMSNESQVSLFKNSTHFNPVDLVCGVKNYKGEKYNLLNFVDEKQGFITEKTKEGKDLKALELPGLWNGAMAFWNTIFVEVPLVTFNPVKTVNDLLKPSHQ